MKLNPWYTHYFDLLGYIRLWRLSPDTVAELRTNNIVQPKFWTQPHKTYPLLFQLTLWCTNRGPNVSLKFFLFGTRNPKITSVCLVFWWKHFKNRSKDIKSGPRNIHKTILVRHKFWVTHSRFVRKSKSFFDFTGFFSFIGISPANFNLTNIFHHFTQEKS